MKAWQARPLEAVYPIIYLDALVVKVRDGHQVRNKAAHIAVGVDMRRRQARAGDLGAVHRGREVLGRGAAPSSATAASQDVLIVCCDGLTGLPGGDRGDLAAHHRANLRGASDPGLDAVRVLQRPQGRRRGAAADLHRRRPWTPPRPRCWTFAEADLAARSTRRRSRTWQDAWERFIPFLAFPPEVRKIIYTTNSDRVAELPAAQDHQEPRPLPQRRRRDQAAVAGDPRHRGQTRPGNAPRKRGLPQDSAKPPAGSSKAPSSTGWKAALGALAIAYPDRITNKIN